jgi:hypothetical protein
MTMGRHDRSGAWEVVMIVQRERERERDGEGERERERRSPGFSPMTPLGGGAVKMATRRRSTEVPGGAPMGRWFWVRGGEIGARVGGWIMGVLSSRLL